MRAPPYHPQSTPKSRPKKIERRTCHPFYSIAAGPCDPTEYVRTDTDYLDCFLERLHFLKGPTNRRYIGVGYHDYVNNSDFGCLILIGIQQVHVIIYILRTALPIPYLVLQYKQGSLLPIIVTAQYMYDIKESTQLHPKVHNPSFNSRNGKHDRPFQCSRSYSNHISWGTRPPIDGTKQLGSLNPSEMPPAFP